ncbi:MAG: hypothetical protein K6T83_21275 [Alicyclobacillus sp.]|nr:hypothetical protein [Alicyclobacillus sp.]
MRLQSTFRALWYRQWRLSRVLLALAYVLIAWPAWSAISHWVSQSRDDFKIYVLWQLLLPSLYGAHYAASNASAYPSVFQLTGQPPVAIFTAIVATALPAALISAERRSGALQFAWTGPVDRVRWLAVHLTSGLAVILLGDMTVAAAYASCNASVPAVPSVQIGAWLAINVLVDIVLFLLTLACACVVTPVVGAMAYAFAIAAVPIIIGSFVGTPASEAGLSAAPFTSPSASTVLRVDLLSPIWYFGSRSWSTVGSGAWTFYSGLTYGAWSYVWLSLCAVAACAAALWAVRQVEADRLDRWCTVGRMRSWLLAFAACIVAVLLGHMTSIGQSRDLLLWHTAAFAALLLGAGTILLQTYQKFRQS